MRAAATLFAWSFISLACPLLLLTAAGCGGGGDEGPDDFDAFVAKCDTEADCVAVIADTSFDPLCTVAICLDGACTFTGSGRDGDTCDDGDLCTIDDACVNRLCSGDEIDCDDEDFCTKDGCDGEAGACAYTVAAFNICNDGIACTHDDRCDQQGGCAGEPGEDCGCATDADCVADASLDKCAGSYRCLEDFTCGVDTADAVTCDPALDTACTMGVCDPVSGDCGQEPRNDGTVCSSDDDPCVAEGLCAQGSCVGSVFVDCDDGNACTSDECVAALGGCTHSDLIGACDDGDPCTLSDVCAGGTCVGTAKECQDINECTTGFCNELTGACVQTPVEGECDDSNACTLDDVCAEGVCTGTPKDCADDNPCTEDVCELVSLEAVCKHKAAPGPCEDGDPCTEDDVCIGGSCIAGLQLCPCDVDDDCQEFEDGDPCNGTLECVQLGELTDCVIDPETVPSCPATGNPCTQSVCLPADGSCGVELIADGTGCDDGDPCTSQGFCTGGGCESLPEACDDEDPCTADLCVGGQCTFEPLTGSETFLAADFEAGLPDGWGATSDLDGVAWQAGPGWDAGSGAMGMVATGAGGAYQGPVSAVLRSPPFEVYGAVTSLRFQAWTELEEPFCGTDKLVVAIEAYGAVLVQQQVCQSNGGWTLYELDLSLFQGQTVRVTFELVANATANSGFGVAIDDVEAIGAFTCDDGAPCTDDDTCVAGACTGAAKACDDGDLCTADSCEAGTGACLHQELDVCACAVDEDCPGAGGCLDVICGPAGWCEETFLTGACDDGDACTEGDACVEGACVGAGITCVDGELCTVDLCDPLNGCVFEPVEASCDDGDPCTEDDACVGGLCAGSPIDCTPDYPCTTGTCNALGECDLEPQHDGQKVLEQKFDSVGPGSLPAGWGVEATDSSWTWETSTTGAASPPNALIVVGPGGAPAAPLTVRVVSPPFALPPAGGDVLYKVSLTLPDATCDDALTVRVGEQTVASFCTSTAGFETHAADLGEFGGQTVTMVFELAVSGAGEVDARIDDFKVTATHPCDDGNPASECDYCFLGQCFPGSGCD